MSRPTNGWAGRSFLCAFLATGLTGGAVAQAQAPTPVPTPAPVSAQATEKPAVSEAARAVGDYRLGVADKVRMIVFNEPTLTGEYIVNSNGALALPLIGDVPASGRTTADLQADIEARFKGGYLRDPHVSIEVLTFRPFYILGEVNKPGQYPFSTGLTVQNAVATAEGFTYRANHHYVFIRSPGETRETRYPLTSTTPVQPGDTIRIGERYF